MRDDRGRRKEGRGKRNEGRKEKVLLRGGVTTPTMTLMDELPSMHVPRHSIYLALLQETMSWS